jgi:hypothetical protein
MPDCPKYRSIDEMPDNYASVRRYGNKMRGNQYEVVTDPVVEFLVTSLHEIIDGAGLDGEAYPGAFKEEGEFFSQAEMLHGFLESVEAAFDVKVDINGDPLEDPLPCGLCGKVAAPTDDRKCSGHCSDYADPCIGYIDDPTIISACCGHGLEQPHIAYRDPPDDHSVESIMYEGASALERLWPDPDIRSERVSMLLGEPAKESTNVQ